MRRRILLIGGTFAVLLLAFVVYSATSRQGLPGIWRWNPQVKPSSDNPALIPDIGEAWPTVNPKVMQYDKNHRLQAVFQAVSQKKVGDRFYVDQPQMEWYLKGGEVITVKADKGVIKAEYQSTRWHVMEGELSGDVWITLDRGKEPDRSSLEERPEDAFRIHLDDAHFDNELLTIYSDSRLNLFSKEADLLGKGLRIEWIEGPRELQQLRIEHGELMTIREGQDRFMSDFALPGSARQPASAPAGKESSSAPPLPWRPLPGPLLLAGMVPAVLAVVNDAPSGPVNEPEAATTATAPTTTSIATMPVRVPPVKDTFVAVFHEDVKVTSGARQIQGADELRLIFDYRAPQREDRRSSAISTLAEKPKEAASQPARAAKDGKGKAQSQPTSKPAGEPVYITWNGPLVIMPLRDNSERIEKRFDVEMIGAKLELADGQSRAECKRVTYHARSQQARLEGTAEEPARLWMATGEEVVAEVVRYDRLAGVINLDGPGHMLLAGEAVSTDLSGRGGKGQREQVHIEWTEAVVADIGQLPGGASADGRSREYLKKATFKGKAHLQQGKTQEMRADEVVVHFSEPETVGGKVGDPGRDPDATSGRRGPLNRASRLEATGGVNLQDHQTGDFVRAETLQVDMGTMPQTGEVYPQKATAAGGVSAKQENAHIEGKELVVTLSPQTDQKTGQMQAKPARLIAKGNVRIQDRTESSPLEVEAEFVDSDLVRRTAILKGSPAKVTQKEGALQGQDIFMDQARELATVTGPGALRFYTDSDLSGNKTGKSEPVDVAWTKGMDYRGTDFAADVNGEVKLDAAGDHLRCQVMRVYFDPNERPKATTTQPANRLTGARTFRPQKLSLVRAEQKVQLTSERKDDEGYLERRMWLATEQLNYAFARNNGKEEGSLNCLGPGLGSVEDYRSPEAVESAKPPEREAAVGVKVVTPNQSAFQWSKSMTMDQKDRSMRFVGDVHMVLREGGAVVMKEKLKVRPWEKLPPAKTSDLSCQSMLARFDPPLETSKPQANDTGPRVGQLRMFRAFGDEKKSDDLIKLADGEREVHCRYMEYNRDTDTGFIYGSMPAEPLRDAVMYFQGKSTSSPQFVWYRDKNRIEARNIRGQGPR